MKYIQNIIIIVSFISMMNFVSEVSAKYYSVHNEKRLHYMLDTYDLVVVLFYDNRMAHECVKQLFKQLSRGYSYHEADVAFVGIDIARNDNVEIARRFGIRKTPVLMLFEDGRLVLGKDRFPVIATDVKSVSDIRIFINTYFGDRIEDILREREEYRRKRARGPRQSGFRFGISFGYPYYPYYGYPFGYSYGYPILYGF